MTLERLREACQAGEVGPIAFIDDIFDTPSAAGLDPGRLAAFRKATLKPEERQAILGIPDGAAVPEPLPKNDEIEDEHIEPYWARLCELSTGQTPVDDPAVAALTDLFREHGDDPIGMLDLVGRICRLFGGELALPVNRFGAKPDIEAVAGMDLILVDFYLERGISVEKAKRDTVALVASIREAAARARRPSPSFVLVSSRPEDVSYEDFRREASLLRSRFRFIAKDILGRDTGTHLLDLHDLFETYKQAAEIEKLIDDWARAAKEAADDVRAKMLEFDIYDFVYLDFFRLYREGTSLGGYLRWLMTAYLPSKLPNRLDRGTWDNAERLRLFDVAAFQEGRLDGQLVKVFDGPGDAIGEAYGAILLDQTRASSNGFPGAPTATDLLEGDLFLENGAEPDHHGSRVRLVMTPSCDLVVRGGGTRPIAESVLFLPGTLHRFTGERKPRELGDIEFARIVEAEQGKPPRQVTYTIEWHFKGVTSMRWEDVAAGGLATLERLGRLREPYFNHVREKFVAGVTRIGREVSPLFSMPRQGAVFAQVQEGGKRKFVELFAFEASDGLVWTFQAVVSKVAKKPRVPQATDDGKAGVPADAVEVVEPAQSEKQPVPVVGAPPEEGDDTAEEMLTHVTRAFLERLSAALTAASFLAPDKRSELLGRVSSFDMASSLLQPGKRGIRMVSGAKAIDVRGYDEPEKAGKIQQACQAELLLLFKI